MPLTSTYATAESLGVERGLSFHWREAPVFYGLLAGFVGFSAIFVLITAAFYATRREPGASPVGARP